MYDSQQEAEEAVQYLRSQGLPAVATNGEDAHLTLQKAFAAKQNTIIRMAETILRGGNEMTQEALSILRATMADMHLPYALGQYRAAPLPETYFVGQWVDAEGFTEDGRTDSTMTPAGLQPRGS